MPTFTFSVPCAPRTYALGTDPPPTGLTWLIGATVGPGASYTRGSQQFFIIASSASPGLFSVSATPGATDEITFADITGDNTVANSVAGGNGVFLALFDAGGYDGTETATWWVCELISLTRWNACVLGDVATVTPPDYVPGPAFPPGSSIAFQVASDITVGLPTGATESGGVITFTAPINAASLVTYPFTYTVFSSTSPLLLTGTFSVLNLLEIETGSVHLSTDDDELLAESEQNLATRRLSINASIYDNFALDLIAYEWTISAIDGLEPINAFISDNPARLRVGYGHYSVQLLLRDEWLGTASESFEVEVEPAWKGAMVSKTTDDIYLTAPIVDDSHGRGLAIDRVTGVLSSRETLGTLGGTIEGDTTYTDFLSPRLREREHIFSLFARQTSVVGGFPTITHTHRRSFDGGRSWQIMGTPWSDAEQFHRVDGIELISGESASIAVKRATSPLEIFYKETNEGNWPNDDDAILSAFYSGDVRGFSLLQLPDTRRVITNHVDLAIISTGKPTDSSDWSDYS